VPQPELFEEQEDLCKVSPNKTLQRSWRHKVLGRGRPSKSAPERWRARVLKGQRAAAELCR
jgi:hypothetical protein